MICGNKQDIEKILPYVSEGLQKALQYIKETYYKRNNSILHKSLLHSKLKHIIQTKKDIYTKYE